MRYRDSSRLHYEQKSKAVPQGVISFLPPSSEPLSMTRNGLGCAVYYKSQRSFVMLPLTRHLASQALADLVKDGVVLDIVAIVGLNLDGDAAQRALQGVLGGGVHHLGLHGVD